ncbi:MAG: SP_1767 family glycosyltransferase [Bacteroidales bacterium]|nr:SP_1767 family glycosyltransferase [Bacteroidales bacterium]
MSKLNHIKEAVVARLRFLIEAYYFYFRKNKGGLNIEILSDNQTIDKILLNHCSVARFGDGELRVIFNEGNGFQDPNQELGKRLKEILFSQEKNCLICLPIPMVNVSGFNFKAKRFWYSFMYDYQERLKDLFQGKQRVFGETNFTRFYIDRLDKEASRKQIEKIMKIWEGRELLIVEGETSRLGVGNDLFSKARSIRRILCPPTNAFSVYDRILEVTKKHANKETLILIALGMTATVLAYDLSLSGFQALDIGHIDIEYEWFLMGAKKKVPIPKKSVNECGRNIINEDVSDSSYLTSIAERIKL